MPATAAKPPLSNATGVFGHRVRAARLAMGLSQEQLAERTELHWSYVGQVERGQNNLTLHNILRFAHVLDVDAGELVTGLEAPDSPARRSRRAGSKRKSSTSATVSRPKRTTASRAAGSDTPVKKVAAAKATSKKALKKAPASKEFRTRKAN